MFRRLYETAKTDPQSLHEAPHHTAVRRLDEVGAARNPSFAIYFNKTKSACLKKFRCAAFVRGAIYYDWQSTILQGNRNQSLR